MLSHEEAFRTETDVSDVTIQCIRGDGCAGWVEAVADLRIRVFREYPYLYDGSREYEERYLRTYVESPDAVVVLARDGDRVVGASTGVPMIHESEAFQDPVAAWGLRPERVFYCGESVLLPAYRGRGIYRRFFEEREGQARRLGRFETMCFCSVIRGPDHPLRPDSYQGLDKVWTHFGYRREPGLECSFRWKDIDQPGETEHRMEFWLKRLTAEQG